MTSRQMYMSEYVKNGKRDTIAQRCGERSKEGERGSRERGGESPEIKWSAGKCLVSFPTKRSANKSSRPVWSDPHCNILLQV